VTLQEVLDTYEKANIVNSESVIFIIFGVIVLCILVNKFLKKFKSESNFNEISFGVVVFSLIILFSFLIQQDRIIDWKKDVKINYIEELPVEKAKVMEYAILKEHPLNENNISKNSISSARIIFLKDGLNREETLDVKIIRDNDIDEPYIEYQYLEQNLPKTKMMSNIEIYKGIYNAILYVPINEKN
jgi:hypothetical protein